MNKTLACGLSCLLMLCLPLKDVAAELNIEITRGAGRRVPIAVVPFGWEGEGARAPYDIDDVISADLRRSGRFEPIAEDSMLQKPDAGVDIDFDDWSILGVEAIVIGPNTPNTMANCIGALVR
jgi:TolB protein